MLLKLNIKLKNKDNNYKKWEGSDVYELALWSRVRVDDSSPEGPRFKPTKTKTLYQIQDEWGRITLITFWSRATTIS